MNIDKKIPNLDWNQKPGLPGGLKPFPGEPEICPEPQHPLKPFPPKDDWFPKPPGPKPIQPIMPSLTLDDPIEAIEEVRRAPEHQQHRELVEFGSKLAGMSDKQLAQAEAYLKSEIAKPYNNDDRLLKDLLGGVQHVRSSRNDPFDPGPKPFDPGPKPFPPHPWLEGGGRVLD